MRTRRFTLWVSHAWRPLFELGLSFVFVAGLLTYRLNTLLPQFSAAEVATRISSSSLHKILNNPLFAPYKLLQYGLISVGHAGPFAMRLVSVLFGIIAIYVMYYVLEQWHGRRVALMGTALFAASSWFLNYARLATPSITYTLLLTTLAYGTWIRNTRRPGAAIVVGAGLLTLLIYTPGLIWFALIGILWQKQSIIRLSSRAPKLSLAAFVLLLIALVPLGYAVLKDTSLLKSLVGLTMTAWPTLGHIGRNVTRLGSLLFVHGSLDPVVGIIGLAIFDVFAVAMLVLGVYDYVFMRKLDRIKMLGGVVILGAVLVSLGGIVSSIILAPFMYVIIAAGIGWLLEQWFTVFPRNPLVRSIGLGLMVVAVSASCWYQLNRYFVAWPQAKATKQVFSIKS